MTSSLNLFWTAISQNAPQRSLAYGIVATWQGLYLEKDWDLSGQFFPVGMGWHCLSGCSPVKRMIKQSILRNFPSRLSSHEVYPRLPILHQDVTQWWLVSMGIFTPSCWQITQQDMWYIIGSVHVTISCTIVPGLSFAGFRRENK